MLLPKWKKKKFAYLTKVYPRCYQHSSIQPILIGNMASKRGQKNPAFKKLSEDQSTSKSEELLQHVQTDEGDAPSSSKINSQGINVKKWKEAFLDYTPAGKSSKNKDETTERASSSSSLTTFQKYARKARMLANNATKPYVNYDLQKDETPN
ncbi:hypothetical protein NPIL_643071 [Nephila pilipes]|uniref:Uncharacterized protein n=1 Tax=Nephila pilipes TaxID=299642 RepID=A0A8X6QUA4_NEPPI|nr:hypothetical protein NPIL_643071 [Nephila pilipes]